MSPPQMYHHLDCIHVPAIVLHRSAHLSENHCIMDIHHVGTPQVAVTLQVSPQFPLRVSLVQPKQPHTWAKGSATLR